MASCSAWMAGLGRRDDACHCFRDSIVNVGPIVCEAVLPGGDVKDIQKKVVAKPKDGNSMPAVQIVIQSRQGHGIPFRKSLCSSTMCQFMIHIQEHHALAPILA
jgi:hypothetical protein